MKSQYVKSHGKGSINSLTKSEAVVLSRSKYADIRLLVIQSRLLSLKRLKELCRKDEDLSVRVAAGGLIKNNLTKVEAVALSRSNYADVRFLSVQSRLLSRRRLKKLCRKDKNESVRMAAWGQIKDDLSAAEATNLSDSECVDVRLAVATHPKTPREILLRLANDRTSDVRKQVFPRILADATPNELGELSTRPDEATRLAVATHPSTSKEVLLSLSTDSSLNVRERALSRVLESGTISEFQSLLKSPLEDVKRGIVKRLGENRDKKGTELILPLLQDPSSQHDAVEALLDIEGNAAISKIIENLGLNTTFRITAERRLISYLKEKEPSEIVEIISLLEKESKQINVGTRTVETEETNYGPYRESYTSTYTTTENVFRNFSYFSPEIVLIVLQILKALGKSKRHGVLALLADQNVEVCRLITLGLENKNWKNSIFEPIIESVKEIKDRNFSAASDESIRSQIV